MIIFDIETAPQPEERLRKLLPPLDESNLVVGDFDAAEVKVGNLKDEKKITEKIEAARAAHEKKKEMQAQILEQARANHWQAFLDAAPLSAAHGRVLCIGIYSPAADVFLCDCGPEHVTLERFWAKCVECIRKSRSIVGLNICEFDLPFLVRRSWILGVAVPNIIGSDLFGKWPKWNERFVDLRRMWLLGCGWSSTKSDFSTLAAAFGTDGKFEGESGGNFWRLWEENREQALAYLEQDVKQPAAWAQRMGVR